MAQYASFGACSPLGQCGTCDAIYPGENDGGGGGSSSSEPIVFGPPPPDSVIAPEEPISCARKFPWLWLAVGVALGLAVN